MSSLFGIGGGGNVGASGSFYDYNIDQSLRVQNGVSQNLTVSSAFPAATDRKKVTISFWYKRALNSTNAEAVYRVSSSGLLIRFNTDGTMYLYDNGAGWQVTSAASDRLFRDPAAYYHFALILDSSQSTASDRAKFYINGDLWSLSTWSVGSGNSRYPTLNANFNAHNGSSATVLTTGTSGLNGYVAEFLSIDGQDVTINDLGETVNGVWVAKEYTGSFGNAGFHLDFADNSAIGNDVSGNNVDFTADAGFAAHDVVPDSPTNNFATMNPLDQEQQGSNKNVYIRGNLDVKSQGNTGYGKTRATFAIPTSGKWYWEMRCTNTIGQSVGILNSSEDLDNTTHFDSFAEGYSYRNDGKVKNNGTSATYGDSWTNLDNIGVLVDADAGEIFFYKNGTIQNSGTAAFTGLDMSNNYMPIWADRSTSGNGRAIFNFGQDSTFYGGETAGGNSDANGNGDFQYTVPASALALCTSNLPEPTIGQNSEKQADDYFNTVLYTGDNAASRAITSVNFAPDWVWLKTRSTTGANFVYDTIRGATKGLHTNLNDAETTYTDGLLSFDSDGFTLGNRGNHNGNGDTFVAWNWKAGGTAVSNTDGSITSSVSAAPEAGFSIVTYASTTGTVGHGLTQAPEAIIMKARNVSDQWTVGHKDIGGGSSPWNYGVPLNTTASTQTNSGFWNNTAPTSTVFSQGSWDSGYNKVAYCFHSVPGYSKVGSYIGNGNADGTFVALDFSPVWVMTKELTATSSWFINDTSRDPYNVADNPLSADTNDSEPSSNIQEIDLLSNGFKIRTDGGGRNTSNNRYIYLAFGDSFKYSNAK